ncbi:hypothetical protein BDN67DRAFT_1071684 [Paxillus ammoniavirescens]|nr:hypothetical protein BDN67DRAFT_1071684 [Paxillus ammoniavirescens]
MSIEIAPPTGPLPNSTPSLMPFHISYTGPAPISRYFRTKPAPPSIPPASTRTTSLVTPVGGQMTMSETQSSLRSLGSMVSEATSTTAVENFLDDNDNGERVLRPANGDNAIMNVDAETQPVSLDPTKIVREPLNDSIGPGPASSNLERLVAAFRGRQMYGQAVGMPEGYGGLVLRAPSLDAKGQGKEDAKVPSKPLSKRANAHTKPKSKFTHATRQSKRASRTEGNDDDDMDREADCARHLAEPPAPIRKLVPTSTFSSFTLWTPDIPVDEGRDEYVRALAEWTKLAAEIHSYDE